MKLPENPTPKERALFHATNAVKNMTAWLERCGSNKNEEVSRARIRDGEESLAMWTEILAALIQNVPLAIDDPVGYHLVSLNKLGYDTQLIVKMKEKDLK